MGTIQYKGRPASGAKITVCERFLPGIKRVLVKSNCNEYGKFCFQANKYLFFHKDLTIYIRYYYQKGDWFNCISGSFDFPIETAITCINRDIAPDLGTLDLNTIPRFTKTRQVRRCNTRRSRSCRTSLMRSCESIH